MSNKLKSVLAGVFLGMVFFGVLWHGLGSPNKAMCKNATYAECRR